MLEDLGWRLGSSKEGQTETQLEKVEEEKGRRERKSGHGEDEEEWLKGKMYEESVKCGNDSGVGRREKEINKEQG